MPPTTRKSSKVAPLHVHASLAHLRACPQCGFRAGAPLMSEGISNEENEGCWYETVCELPVIQTFEIFIPSCLSA